MRVTRRLLGEWNEYVELNEKGMPKVQAVNLWNLSFKTRSVLVSFSNAHRWQTILVLLAMYNFANRDDSHLLRRGVYGS